MNNQKMTDKLRELKPCPFCDCSSEITFVMIGTPSYTIKCKSCGCSFGQYSSKKAIIRMWNTRPDTSELKAEVERLKKNVKYHAGIRASQGMSSLLDLQDKNQELRTEKKEMGIVISAWKLKVKEMEKRVDELENTIHKVNNWCKAYPVSVFPKPTKDDYRKATEILKENGYHLCNFSLGFTRYVLEGIEKILTDKEGE